MTRLKNKVKQKYIILCGILLLGFLAYVVQLTHAGLWYDEAIEYFYSKVIYGVVPGGFGHVNMYERICSTYQPPLYNILMYFWLSIFDSEFGFRMAGVIITLIGAIGIFKGLEELTQDIKYSSLGTLLYIFTYSVGYYALECAEYNLMLCFLSWTAYFYIRIINRMDVPSLVGFFMCACLSVYSQYGAAFVVIGMFVSIAVHIIKNRNWKLLQRTIFITGIVLIVFVIPLIIFFLLPQMNKQGSVDVSHHPVFIYNIAIDFIISFVNSLRFFLGGSGVLDLGLLICLIGGGMAGFFAGIVIVKKEKEIFPLLITILVSWTCYFIAVACSFYGYNNWSGALGTYNIGGRYALFFIPVVLLTLVDGVRLFLDWVREKRKSIYKILAGTVLAYAIVFCGIGVVKLDFVNWNKGDVRELVSAWYEADAYTSNTLVHQWEDAVFQFYLIHDQEYDESFQEQIYAAEIWIRTAEYSEMKEKLGEMGYLDMDEFYYICPVKQYTDSYQAFIDVMEDHGFEIKRVYEENTALLHLVRRLPHNMQSMLEEKKEECRAGGRNDS